MSSDTRLSLQSEAAASVKSAFSRDRPHREKHTDDTEDTDGASHEIIAGANRVVLCGSETRLNFRCLVCRFFDTVRSLPEDRPDLQSFPSPVIIPFRRPGER